MVKIEIKAPRYHDRTVLIAKHKVGINNEIVFTEAPSLIETYTISGKEVEKCPVESNGTIDCYAVPLDKLKIKEAMELPPADPKTPSQRLRSAIYIYGETIGITNHEQFYEQHMEHLINKYLKAIKEKENK